MNSSIYLSRSVMGLAPYEAAFGGHAVSDLLP